ncbi:hypothetical protein ACTXT7_003704 [Hymenolepis weldensis]
MPLFMWGNIYKQTYCNVIDIAPDESSPRKSMMDDTNRRPARVFPPVQHDNNAEYSDQIEFRYAPTTWSDTESLDRSMNAMRINGDYEDSVFTMREKSKGLDEGKNDQSATDASGNRSSRTEDDDEDCSIGSITGRRMNVTEQMKRSQPYIMALLAGKSPTLRSPLGSLSQAPTTNGRGNLDSERSDRYSPFPGGLLNNSPVPVEKLNFRHLIYLPNLTSLVKMEKNELKSESKIRAEESS